MPAHDHSRDEAPRVLAGDKPFGRAWWVFGGFAAFVVILFTLEHRAHLVDWLPWLILLACPLMHVFMHGGHGSGESDGAPTKREGGK